SRLFAGGAESAGPASTPSTRRKTIGVTRTIGAAIAQAASTVRSTVLTRALVVGITHTTGATLSAGAVSAIARLAVDVHHTLAVRRSLDANLVHTIVTQAVIIRLAYAAEPADETLSVDARRGHTVFIDSTASTRLGPRTQSLRTAI